MSLAEQRAAELNYQLRALKDEFLSWQQRTQAKQPLEKHHTQVYRITLQLNAFLDEMGTPTASFDELETFSRKLLGAHRIWAYYRSKLALREVEWFRQDLVCADEFAWHCYRPAREKAEAAKTIATGALKEPPLVFFSNEAAPFMQPRESAFHVEGLTKRDVKDLKAALLTLPIPVIGVPWFQVHHLPSSVVIGHEVGHAVEEDFDLEDTIQARIDGLAEIAAERRSAWKAWSSEIFADLYGILCTGPAHVMALMDYLADDLQTVRNERLDDKDWGAYPTRFLRMLFNCQVLSAVGFEGKAQELEAVWKGTYKFHAMTQFEDDIPKLVAALLSCPFPAFGGASLPQVISFTPDDLSSAQTIAIRINKGFLIPPGLSFRQLLAGATLAFRTDPAKYADKNGQQAVVERMLQAIPPGVRSAKKDLSDEERNVRDEADLETGRSLSDLF